MAQEPKFKDGDLVPVKRTIDSRATFDYPFGFFRDGQIWMQMRNGGYYGFDYYHDWEWKSAATHEPVELEAITSTEALKKQEQDFNLKNAENFLEQCKNAEKIMSDQVLWPWGVWYVKKIVKPEDFMYINSETGRITKYQSTEPDSFENPMAALSSVLPDMYGKRAHRRFQAKMQVRERVIEQGKVEGMKEALGTIMGKLRS